MLVDVAGESKGFPVGDRFLLFDNFFWILIVLGLSGEFNLISLALLSIFGVETGVKSSGSDSFLYEAIMAWTLSNVLASSKSIISDVDIDRRRLK